MTSEELIEEGRRLQRPCSFLLSEGSGEVAARWYERDEIEIESTGHRCWLSVNARLIPGVPESLTGYVSVFSDEKRCRSGYVEVTTSWPDRKGVDLYAHSAHVLPPIDAVFARGSEAVGEWIRSHGWERACRYNDNFKGAAIVGEYERIWFSEFPIYSQADIYAVLGGWHLPGADADWHELIDDQLMVLTVRDSEPWVEAWRTRGLQFKVIQRIT